VVSCILIRNWGNISSSATSVPLMIFSLKLADFSSHIFPFHEKMLPIPIYR
jgi:hypothetical protein